MCAFNDGLDHLELLCVCRGRKTRSNGWDEVFSSCVKQWQKGSTKDEPKLTRTIASKISDHADKLGFYAHSEVPVGPNNQKTPPRIAVLLSPSKQKTDNEECTTPHAVIEFGLHGTDWSKRLDQNVKYMDLMVEFNGELKSDTLLFESPILFGVITVEDEKLFDFKVAVSSVRGETPIALVIPCDEFRMSLLWKETTDSLDTVSKYFRRLLQVAHDFSRWRKDLPKFTVEKIEF